MLKLRKSSIVFLIVVSCFSYLNAQDYELLEQEFDIWETDDSQLLYEGRRALETLCKKFDFLLENEKIDCSSIALSQRAFLTNTNHIIKKRDANEQLEGSGNDELDLENLPSIQLEQQNATEKLVITNFDEEISLVKEPAILNVSNDENIPPEPLAEPADSEISAVNELPIELADHEISAVNEPPAEPADPEISDVNEPPVEPVNPEISTVNETLAEPADPEITALNEPPAEPADPEISAINEPPAEPADLEISVVNETPAEPIGSEISAVNEPPAEPADPEISAVNVTVVPEITNVVSNETLPLENKENAPEDKQIDTNSNQQLPKEDKTANEQLTEEANIVPLPEVEIPVEQGSPNTAMKESSDKNEQNEKNPPKALPSDLVEVDPTFTKEKESIYDLQSNNAAILNQPHEKQIQGVEGSDSENVLKKMATKANEQVENDIPNTGESAKDVQRASKSTTILVVLLVVVLVVGAAIFIRKYTRKNQATSQVTTANEKNGDIEQGTELKPLMKEGSKPVKEYSDSTAKEAAAK